MCSYKIFDQEMTKEKFANDKKLKAEIDDRRKEVLEELGKKIIEVSDCDFDGNSTCVFLTNTGYVYKEHVEYGGFNYDIELVGYMDSKRIDEFMSYLLDDEKILKRKNISLREMSGICDYNVGVSFCFNNKEHDIPDDIFCANNSISKCDEKCFSNRIIDKMYKLVEETNDKSDFKRREELRKELRQIDRFVEMYGNKEFDIPNFLKRKQEQ